MMQDQKVDQEKNIKQTQKVCLRKTLRTQKCPVCGGEMGDMPGSRDAYCSECGFKDPCCE